MAKKNQNPEEQPAAAKKKDLKFLAVYITIFVVVISGLIGGSYLITSRIRQEFTDNNNSLNSSQSLLKNIQDENAALKKENQTLQQSNAALTEVQKENEALLELIGNTAEQDQYLLAAQSAYIDGDKDLAEAILSAVERDKLSLPNRAYYDSLRQQLGL